MSHVIRIAAVALIVLAGLWGWREHAQNASLTRQLTQMRAANAANAKAVTEVRRNAAASVKAAETDARAQVARARAIANIRGDIAHAKPKPGACETVGPHLRAALDGLRRLQSAGAH